MIVFAERVSYNLFMISVTLNPSQGETFLGKIVDSLDLSSSEKEELLSKLKEMLITFWAAELHDTVDVDELMALLDADPTVENNTHSGITKEDSSLLSAFILAYRRVLEFCKRDLIKIATEGTIENVRYQEELFGGEL